MVDGRFDPTDRWLIDGQQRCNALWSYVNDEFPIFVGTEHEHRWSDLNIVEQRLFRHLQIGYKKLQSNNENHLPMISDSSNLGGRTTTNERRKKSLVGKK